MRPLGQFAIRVLLGVAVLVLVVVGLGPLTGTYRIATVLSGSMGRGMPVGSVAVVVPVDPADIHVGDVITFQAPTAGEPVVTHRVVEILEPGRHPVVRTKGDANQSPDPWTARLANAPAWRRVAVVPHVGSVIRFLRSTPVHRVTVQGVPFVLLVAMLAAIWSPGSNRLRRRIRRMLWWAKPKKRRLTAVASVVVVVAAVPAALAGFTSSPNASNSIGAAPDWTPPSVSSTVIAKQTGFLGGTIKQGSLYYVYANVADSGNPPSGISTVKTDVSAISLGLTAVSLTSGSYSVNGVSYNYRSGLLTAIAVLSGTKNYTITSTDALSYSQLQAGYSVTLDNSAPTATGISTGNAGGGNHGLAETGDTITFTFSEQIDPQSILAGWTGASTNVTVVFSDGGCVLVLCGNDGFSINNAANTASLPFGSINLNSSGYYGCTVIGIICSKTDAAFVNSPMVQSGSSITITLGTRSGGNGSFNDVGSNNDMAWDSVTTPYDAAGNTASGNTYTEGDNDYEF